MTTAFIILRWLHIIVAAAWYGEVVTINFVLVPAVNRLPKDQAPKVLFEIFPRIFKLASWLSATAVISGILLAILKYKDMPEVMWTTTPGLMFSIGAILALLLTFVHFVLEPRLDGMICTAAASDDIELSDRVMWLLKLVPRVGLVVITLILWTMTVGAHGLAGLAG